jgi:sugar/nucleoside kinase (ribokinase family)
MATEYRRDPPAGHDATRPRSPARDRTRGRPIEVVHVGSACRDIAPDDPRGWRLGGGVTYSALTTARLGLRTAAVVGVDPEARTAAELDLIRDAGADLMLVPLAEGPVYHNVETPAGRVQTCVRVGLPLPVPPLPDSWLATRSWSIAPVAGEVGDEWVEPISREAFVGVAWQGFLRDLAPGAKVTRRPPRPSPLLARADAVGVSHHDLDPATPLADLYPLLAPGGRLLVTQGVDGGLLVTLDDAGRPVSEVRYRATRSDREVDPTGAGDTFLAALLSTAVRRAIAGRSHGAIDLPFAAAAGSLVVEAPGLAGVPDRAATLVRMTRDRVRRLVTPSHAERVGEHDD